MSSRKMDLVKHAVLKVKKFSPRCFLCAEEIREFFMYNHIVTCKECYFSKKSSRIHWEFVIEKYVYKGMCCNTTCRTEAFFNRSMELFLVWKSNKFHRFCVNCYNKNSCYQLAEERCCWCRKRFPYQHARKTQGQPKRSNEYAIWNKY